MTKAKLHAHHIVLKTLPKSGKLRKFIKEAQDILEKHDIDVLYDTDNLTWAINWDHSMEYVKAVAKALREADELGGKEAVKDALERIAKIVSEGKKFRGFE